MTLLSSFVARLPATLAAFPILIAGCGGSFEVDGDDSVLGSGQVTEQLPTNAKPARGEAASRADAIEGTQLPMELDEMVFGYLPPETIADLIDEAPYFRRLREANG